MTPKHSAQADDLKAYVANAAEAVCEAGISRQEKKQRPRHLCSGVVYGG